MTAAGRVPENHASRPAGGSGRCGWLRRRCECGVCRQTVAMALLTSDSGKCWGSERNGICFNCFKTACSYS